MCTHAYNVYTHLYIQSIAVIGSLQPITTYKQHLKSIKKHPI